MPPDSETQRIKSQLYRWDVGWSQRAAPARSHAEFTAKSALLLKKQTSRILAPIAQSSNALGSSTKR